MNRKTESVFIPTETEINELIGNCADPLCVIFLCLLRETGLRFRDVINVRLNDLECETIRVYSYAHGCRSLSVSTELLTALNTRIPKNGDYLFKERAVSIRHKIECVKKKLALTRKNHRYMQITFHSIRRWKATELYKEGKSLSYIDWVLGHRHRNQLY